MRILSIIPILALVSAAPAQIVHFPYTENFDSVTIPALPSGWSTSANRQSSGDFTTTHSTALSDSNAVVSTNATIQQTLETPILNFSRRVADSLVFFERRSSTHNSGLVAEASVDGGSTYPYQAGGTLLNPGTTSYVRRALGLPAALDDQAAVRIRWRVLGDGTGTSGTLRLDDLRISARAELDAGIIAVLCAPVFPAAGDTVRISACVMNYGTGPAEGIAVCFYDDLDHDSAADESELFAEIILAQTLEAGDTSTATALFQCDAMGTHFIMARCTMPDDQDTTNDLAGTALVIGSRPGSIVISEIMYAPSEGEPEWIELFNATQRDVDLSGWTMGNRITTSRFEIAGRTTLLAGGGYCVIIRDTSVFRQFHPEPAGVLLQVSSLPIYLFNNNGDAAVILDSRGAQMDSVHFARSWGGTDGKSLERIEADGSSTDSANWGSPIGMEGSTPGRPNSLTPLPRDLMMLRLNAVAVSPSEASIEMHVRNVGHDPVAGFAVSLYYDKDEDSSPAAAELIATREMTGPLSPNDSAILTISWEHPPAGIIRLIGTIEDSSDGRRSNDTAFGMLTIPSPPASIVINEIMYDPSPGECEYIELYNRSAEPINLRGWTISDAPDTNEIHKSTPLQREHLSLSPGEYTVVAADSSILRNHPWLSGSSARLIMRKAGLGLNNAGDLVILADASASVCDSVRYFPSWHNAEMDDVQGRSLERINPDFPSNDSRDWSTSADLSGGTPGLRNSIYASETPSEATLTFAPNPFSPDGDGHEDFAVISYRIPQRSALLRVKIFDVKGRLIRTLANGEPTGSRGERIWNGFNDDHARVRIGMYIVVLEALGEHGDQLMTARGIIVVGRKF